MDSCSRCRRLIALLTFVAVGFASTSAGAAETASWSETVARSNVLVQDCHGASVLSGFSPNLAFGLNFEVSTSYQIDRDVTRFTDSAGINHPAMERQVVSFTGVVANSKSGRSLAYDGHFTRTSGDTEDVTITDLVLRLIPANQEAVTITVARDTSGVIDSPEAMLLAFAPRGVQTSLCLYFAGITNGE